MGSFLSKLQIRFLQAAPWLILVLTLAVGWLVYRLGELEEAVDGHYSDIDDTQSEVEELRARLGRLTSDVEEVQSEVGDLDRKIRYR